MSILPILLHPDPRLTKNCDLVTEFGDKTRAFADNMLETMYDAPGVGLAAPQVGVLKRVFVMDCGGKEETSEPTVLFNPQVLWVSDEMNVHNEGCLSLPELFEDVERPAAVKMRYQDATGTTHERDFDELWATCAQHELDHLNGKLFIDHLSRMKRSMMTKKMVKYKKEMAVG